MVATVLLVACAPRVELEPQPIDVTPPGRTVAPLPDAGSRTVTVFFVREGRLVAVERAVDKPTLAAALALLLAGPTEAEAATGIRTALLPGSLLPADSQVLDRTAIVAATPRFTSASGGNQVVAVAQLVWTATDANDVDNVSISVHGQRLEISTEAGLTGALVRRSDYASLAPAPPSSTTSRGPAGPAALGVAAV